MRCGGDRALRALAARGARAAVWRGPRAARLLAFGPLLGTGVPLLARRDGLEDEAASCRPVGVAGTPYMCPARARARPRRVEREARDGTSEEQSES